MKSPTPQFHYDLADIYLDESVRHFAAVVARGHAKTTYAKAFLLHRLYYPIPGRPPAFLVWIADTVDKVFNNMDYIEKAIVSSRKLRYYFGNIHGKAHGKKWNETYKETRDGHTLMARSMAKGVRGETKANITGGAERIHVAFLDDIENEKNTITRESRNSIKKIVTNAIDPALDPVFGRMIMNATPVDQDSLCQNIVDAYHKAKLDGTLDQYSWKVVYLPATQPKMPGGVLWPGYFSKKRLDDRKQFYIDTYGSASGYYQEYELQPQGDDTRIWGRDHYHLHRCRYEWNDELKQSFLVNEFGVRFMVSMFLGCDPATDIESLSSDKSVIMIIAVDTRGHIYVVDYVSERSIPERGLRGEDGKLIGKKGVVDYIMDMYKQYHCKNGVLEDHAMTRGVWNNLRQAQLDAKNHSHRIIPEEPQGRDKLEKIKAGLSSYFSTKIIHLREDMWELREQIEGFGKRMTHDDVIESLFFSTRYIITPVDNLETRGGRFRRKQEPEEEIDWQTR